MRSWNVFNGTVALKKASKSIQKGCGPPEGFRNYLKGTWSTGQPWKVFKRSHGPKKYLKVLQTFFRLHIICRRTVISVARKCGKVAAEVVQWSTSAVAQVMLVLLVEVVAVLLYKINFHEQAEVVGN